MRNATENTVTITWLIYNLPQRFDIDQNYYSKEISEELGKASCHDCTSASFYFLFNHRQLQECVMYDSPLGLCGHALRRGGPYL